MKLTLISVIIHSRRYSAFVQVQPDSDGKVRLSEHELFKLLGLDHTVRGITYTPGG